MRADLIITNGNVRSGRGGRHQAVACADGRIAAVGTNDEITPLAGPGATRIDAKGRLVLPGFTDAHIHFLLYAQFRRRLSLVGVESRREAIARVSGAVRESRGGWVLGWGWSDGDWDEPPDARALDAVTGDTPVALVRIDLHSWWVNGAALRAAGIARETPDPPRGGIERGPDGRPTGVLREWDAIDLVARAMPPETVEARRAAVRSAIRELHGLGITGVHDLRLENDGFESLDTFRAMEDAGEFALRAHVHVTPAQLDAVGTYGADDAGRAGGSRVRVGPVKLFADGSLGSRTASMLAPYENDPANRGVIVTSRDEIVAHAERAGEYDRPLTVHAIGDRAVRDVLQAFAIATERRVSSGAPPLALPHRIEHAQIVHADDLARFADARVMTSVQPAHLMGDMAVADRDWGTRARYAYAFRSLLDHGARLAFGSDAPVATVDPMHGIHAAVTRCDTDGRPAGGWYPGQKLTIGEAIDGYTTGPALASGNTETGAIAPGMRADLVVLSHDLYAIPPDRLLETRVVQTVFDGELVHDAE